MIAIIKKELRENIQWAAALCAALGLWMIWAVSEDSLSGMGLIGAHIWALTACGFAGAGFILGMVQVLQDRTRGRWAFLIHRPLSPSRIFAGKVLGGLILYLGTVMIPLGLATLWMYTPHHLAGPFDWHTLLPRLADILGGTVAYAAGLHCAARQARWAITRLMPVVSAGLCLLAISAGVQSGALTAALMAAALAVFLIAAWGAFCSGGSFENQPWFARAAAAVDVGAGVVISVNILAGISVVLLSTMGVTRNEEIQQSALSQYKIHSTGQVLYYSQKWAGMDDAHGNRVDDWNKTLGMETLALEAPTNLTGPYGGEMPQGFHDQGAYMERAIDEHVGRMWMQGYYVHSRRTIEIYEVNSRRFIGSLGPDGFLPPDQTPQPFAQPVRVARQQLIATERDVYETRHFENMRKVFTAPADESIIDASQSFELKLIFVVTQSNLYILMAANPEAIAPTELVWKEPIRIPLDHGFPPYRWLNIGRPSVDRYVLQYTNADVMGLAQPHLPDWVETASASGEITQRIEVNPQPARYSSIDQPRFEPIGCVMPPCFLFVFDGPSREEFLSDTFHGAPTAICTLLSAIMVVLIGKRYLRSSAGVWIWTILTLALGVTGLLAMMALHQRKAMLRCNACGKMRPVEQNQCPHCSAEFPAPAFQGIEVFETAQGLVAD